MAKVTEEAKGTIQQDTFVREATQKGFLEPRLLYLIKRSPTYGYQLMEEVGALPLPVCAPDSAAVYRMLREMEKGGLVRSHWEHGETGPSKRIYQITADGEERLGAWKNAFRQRVKLLNRFIAMCEKLERGDDR